MIPWSIESKKCRMSILRHHSCFRASRRASATACHCPLPFRQAYDLSTSERSSRSPITAIRAWWTMRSSTAAAAIMRSFESLILKKLYLPKRNVPRTSFRWSALRFSSRFSAYCRMSPRPRFPLHTRLNAAARFSRSITRSKMLPRRFMPTPPRWENGHLARSLGQRASRPLPPRAPR